MKASGTAKSKSVKPAESLQGDALDTSKKLQQLATELESGLTRARRSVSQTSRASSRSGRSPSAALVEARAEELRARRLKAQEAGRAEAKSGAAKPLASRPQASRSRTPSFSDPARPTPKFGHRLSGLADRQGNAPLHQQQAANQRRSASKSIADQLKTTTARKRDDLHLENSPPRASRSTEAAACDTVESEES